MKKPEVINVTTRYSIELTREELSRMFDRDEERQRKQGGALFFDLNLKFPIQCFEWRFCDGTSLCYEVEKEDDTPELHEQIYQFCLEYVGGAQ